MTMPPITSKGQMYALLNILPNVKSRALVRAMLSSVTGMDVAGVRDLALHLGGYNEEKVEMLVRLVERLSAVFGETDEGSAALMIDQDSSITIVQQIASQIASQAPASTVAKEEGEEMLAQQPQKLPLASAEGDGLIQDVGSNELRAQKTVEDWEAHRI